MAQAVGELQKMTIDEIKQQYPLHYLVWTNDYEELKKELVKPLSQVRQVWLTLHRVVIKRLFLITLYTMG